MKHFGIWTLNYQNGTHGHKQNKISLDVAADSLSFTSLVCIDPNQHSKFLPAQSHATDKKSRLPMVSQKTSEDAKNGGQKEAYGSKSWFGRKLFQSLVSPCRECRAFKPNTPTPTEVEESTMGFRLGIVE
ncbi:hypothetical protein V6N13_053434 [Hibiscus sabdariffa]